MTPLQKAAQAVIASITDDEWIEAYEELRKALDAEIAQAVEPVAWGMRRPVTPLVLDIICPEEHARHEGEYTIPLYLHPPQPQAAITAANWLIRKEPNTKDKYYVAEGNPPARVLDIYGITQGEKP